MTEKTDHLAGVYKAQSVDEIAELYNAWADGYEDHMAKAGYRHPSIAAALLARYLPRDQGPVLDAGAGTGLLGPWLQILGYGPLEALDISDGMLALARAKGAYATFHKAALGGDLPMPEGHFAGLVCSGVLTTGHVGPEALPGMIRVVRPGGILVLTIKDEMWEQAFSDLVSRLVRQGVIDFLESTVPYLSMPDGDHATPSRAVVLKRL